MTHTMGAIPLLEVIGKRIVEGPFPFQLQRSSLCAARGRLMNLKRGMFRLLVVGSAFWTIGLTILTYSERKSATNSLPPSPAGALRCRSRSGHSELKRNDTTDPQFVELFVETLTHDHND